MRIVIITPQEQAHSRHFCAYLGRKYELVRVIHPAPARSGVRARLRRARKELTRSGVAHSLYRAMAALPNPWVGWDATSAIREAEKRFFPGGVAAEYDEVVAPVAARVVDVNADATIRLVQEAAADVVLCLGGPIYRAPLIKACGTMINFHSGVSPVYNGASTILFAFANGHFRLCGGTLMTMSPTVDGGDILAHYLPAIEAADTPATLFMKTVSGAAETASRFLRHLESTGSFSRCPQPSPLFYYASRDWTVHYSRQVRRHLERGSAAKAARPAELVEYYSSASDREAGAHVRETIERLLGFEWVR
jgi:methionyl-tRNA formyltransferase